MTLVYKHRQSAARSLAEASSTVAMKSFVAVTTFAAVALATTPTTAENCAMHCNLAMDGCVATGSPISVCTDVYIECLGYNPYDEVPFNKPTSCRK